MQKNNNKRQQDKAQKKNQANKIIETRETAKPAMHSTEAYI